MASFGSGKSCPGVRSITKYALLDRLSDETESLACGVVGAIQLRLRPETATFCYISSKTQNMTDLQDSERWVD